MKHVQQIQPNFIYPEIKPELYKFGSSPIIGVALREDGDWRGYLPPDEYQNVRGIESSACYVESQQAAIATIEEESLGELDNNYSARFNALLSGGTQNGGDPLKAADSFRHDGLIKDCSMPFGNEIQSWDDFHSWKGVDQTALRKEGQNYLTKKILSYDLVFDIFENVKNKYLKMKQALKYSPLPVSVSAWYEENGVYIKPEGMRDNHLVELVYIDENNCPYIRDTYSPFIKKLDAFYDFDFGMRWVVEKKTEQEQIGLSVWQILLEKGLVAFFVKFWTDFIAKPVITPIAPIISPTPQLSNRQKIHNEAISWLGKDASVLDLAPDETGCAESVSNIIHNVIPQFEGSIISTAALAQTLDDCKFFKRVTVPFPGCIIVSPRTPTTFGHSGIWTTASKIISNDSSTGKMAINYSWDSWIREFKEKRKLRILMWDAI